MSSNALPCQLEPPVGQDEQPAFFTPKALEAMQRAVSEAVSQHHRLGQPVAIWQDGRVVQLFPDGSVQPVEPASALTHFVSE